MHEFISKFLKFGSFLPGSGYPSGGRYHFPLNSQSKTTEDGAKRASDLVVSKSNQLLISFEWASYEDSFTLEYSLVKSVFVEEAQGSFKSAFNDLVKPFIFVSKQTDQSWRIRAPYGKRLQLTASKFDLVNDESCSIARVQFLAANGTLMDTRCGKGESSSSSTHDNSPTTLVTSDSSEVTVSFVTQNSDEVSVHRTDHSQRVYLGFQYYFAVVSEPGDCYFNKRSEIMCGYTNLEKRNANNWRVLSENEATTPALLDAEFSRQFCVRCHLSAQLVSEASSTLVSPLVSAARKFLRFKYQLGENSRLSVRLVYARFYEVGLLDDATILVQLSQATSGGNGEQWRTVEVSLGNAMYEDYRLMFELKLIVSVFLIVFFC